MKAPNSAKAKFYSANGWQNSPIGDMSPNLATTPDTPLVLHKLASPEEITQYDDVRSWYS